MSETRDKPNGRLNWLFAVLVAAALSAAGTALVFAFNSNGAISELRANQEAQVRVDARQDADVQDKFKQLRDDNREVRAQLQQLTGMVGELLQRRSR